MGSKIMNFIADLFGFRKNSAYIARHNTDANVSSSIYMTTVTILIEIWMIIRYIKRYVLDAGEPADFVTVMKYTRNFWILLILALAVLIYALCYKMGKIRSRILTDIVMIIFAGSCVGFGMYVSHLDFASGKMVTCFLTMSLYVACLLIWKPYVSMLILGTMFFGYACYLNHYTFTEEGIQVTMRSGDWVNYVTFLIALAMVAISIYHQRLSEARKSEELERAAIEDDLTGVPNQYYFSRQCEELMKDWSTNPAKKIYLFLNIENFKTYNDQLGYEKGNEFLKHIAGRFAEIFSDAIFARQSDDHFIALVDAERKDEYISKADAEIGGGHSEIYLSLKVGGYRPLSREEAPLICCDRARYACGLIKNQYGKTYREYDKALGESFHLRQYVVNHIDQAVAEGYIQVYYQPVVFSKDGKVCGCEALARWIDPKHGFLSPGKFIPVLEECKQIHKLDSYIYETVCRDMHLSIERDEPVVPVSMNFSRLDFELMDVVKLMSDLVERYDIPKDMLHIEVTESTLSENQEKLQADLARFRELGFALWLDDFGSGYSSLNVLKDYKFDVLKVDMVFLHNLKENESAQHILSCIIEMADKLGMQTLTEGIETDFDAEFLTKIGCGRLQGYYYAKPMPYAALQDKIATGELKVTLEDMT
ncbi:MAG: EAL domain-containing protein [Saccharofermentans sp.]|nr:EAL domain-containing protein [Saccharofermentans sp.]